MIIIHYDLWWVIRAELETEISDWRIFSRQQVMLDCLTVQTQSSSGLSSSEPSWPMKTSPWRILYLILLMCCTFSPHSLLCRPVCGTEVCFLLSICLLQAFVKVGSGLRLTLTTMTTTSRLAGRWRSAARWRPRRRRSCSSAGWRTAGRWGAPSGWSSPTPTLTSRQEPPTSTSSTSNLPTSAPTPAWRRWGTEGFPRSVSTSTSHPPQVSHAVGGALIYLNWRKTRSSSGNRQVSSSVRDEQSDSGWWS